MMIKEIYFRRRSGGMPKNVKSPFFTKSKIAVGFFFQTSYIWLRKKLSMTLFSTGFYTKYRFSAYSLDVPDHQHTKEADHFASLSEIFHGFSEMEEEMKTVYCMHLLGYELDDIVTRCSLSKEETVCLIEKGYMRAYRKTDKDI